MIEIYLFLGLLFTIFEHRSYDFDFSEFTRKETIIAILQQIVHYTRYILTWPWYIIEDLLIMMDNEGKDEEDG